MVVQAVAPTFDWNALLYEIEQQNVIPIIGRQLYGGPPARDAGPHDPIAAQLAIALGYADLGPGVKLHEVAIRALGEGRTSAELYTNIRMIAGGIQEIPNALRQLAKIRRLRLFVTTAFDLRLERALELERGVAPGSLAFFLDRRVDDLTESPRTSPRPTVYHILGKLEGRFALTEADFLEYLHRLQSLNRPERLFEELEGRNLLFLGCGFQDWLARFFFRIMKNGPFTREETRAQIVADDNLAQESGLVLFLRHYQLSVSSQPSVAEFVDELQRRWVARVGQEPDPEGSGGAVATPDDMKDGSVFLSYCREDEAAVQAIARALDAAGVDVWFDRSDLQDLGVDWHRRIQRNIRRASLFLAFVSKATEGRAAGPSYFWSEWELGMEVASSWGPDATFLVPVDLAGIDPGRAHVPDGFGRRQWSSVRDDTSRPAFVAKVKETFRANQLRMRR